MAILLSFVAVVSGIRNPGPGMEKNQDLASGISIPGPHHCLLHILADQLTDRKYVALLVAFTDCLARHDILLPGVQVSQKFAILHWRLSG
jgi:hypothetical protein